MSFGQRDGTIRPNLIIRLCVDPCVSSPKDIMILLTDTAAAAAAAAVGDGVGMRGRMKYVIGAVSATPDDAVSRRYLPVTFILQQAQNSQLIRCL